MTPHPFIDREAGKRIAEAALVAVAVSLATKAAEAIWKRGAKWLEPDEPKGGDDDPKEPGGTSNG